MATSGTKRFFTETDEAGKFSFALSGLSSGLLRVSGGNALAQIQFDGKAVTIDLQPK